MPIKNYDSSDDHDPDQVLEVSSSLQLESFPTKFNPRHHFLFNPVIRALMKEYDTKKHLQVFPESKVHDIREWHQNNPNGAKPNEIKIIHDLPTRLFWISKKRYKDSNYLMRQGLFYNILKGGSLTYYQAPYRKWYRNSDHDLGGLLDRKFSEFHPSLFRIFYGIPLKIPDADPDQLAYKNWLEFFPFSEFGCFQLLSSFKSDVESAFFTKTSKGFQSIEIPPLKGIPHFMHNLSIIYEGFMYWDNFFQLDFEQGSYSIIYPERKGSDKRGWSLPASRYELHRLVSIYLGVFQELDIRLRDISSEKHEVLLNKIQLLFSVKKTSTGGTNRDFQ